VWKLWILLLVLPVATLGADRRAPWTTPYPTGNAGRDANYGALVDTLFAQQSDTTDAIYVGDCSNLTAFVGAAGCDSVNMVVQGSLDGTNWATFATAIGANATNQNLASYGVIRNVLVTNANPSGSVYHASGYAKWARVIVKNNSKATGNPDIDTLITVSAGIFGPCARVR